MHIDHHQSSTIVAPVLGIERLRLLTDGGGVTTLVGFRDCPLRCKYCLNKKSLDPSARVDMLTPMQLYKRVRVDNLYFIATGGGITFGGGEPGLKADFIKEFRRICGRKWKIAIETTLNLPKDNVETLMDVVDEYIIDIKDLDPGIYSKYSGITNNRVVENLRLLSGRGLADRAVIRVPLIPGFNNRQNLLASIETLKEMGFTRFDTFVYSTTVEQQKERRREVRKDIDKAQADNSTPAGGKYNYYKGVCEVMKTIRIAVAQANDIDYIPHDCPHTLCARGTCPLCEAELRKIETALISRQREGKKVTI